MKRNTTPVRIKMMAGIFRCDLVSSFSFIAYFLYSLLCKGRANGLRYPRWGGRRNAVRLEKC
jgi:hypothetical protein